ncbi:MAG: hypothetical protein RLZZ336_1407 [Cyanobacteriota bacterium]|jgi:hypothetical protein
MAYFRSQLPVSVPVHKLDHLIADLIGGIGMQVETQSHPHAWMIGTDPPQPALRPEEHVTLLCDWSNLHNTGELTIETRSGESMAHARTRAQSLLLHCCGTLQGPLAGDGG